MPECQKCGNNVTEEMVFCPKCGASLKAEAVGTTGKPEPPVRLTHEKQEKYEKREKREKDEKGEREKHEKREFAFIGPLIGGLILLFIGLTAFAEMSGIVNRGFMWAILLVIIGVLVIVGAIYAVAISKRRHPPT